MGAVKQGRVGCISGLGLCMFLRRFVGIDPDGVLIHELATQKTGDADQRRRQQRCERTPGQDGSSGVAQAQQPVERSQREQHDGDYGVRPGRDEAPYASDGDQVHQAGQPGNPPPESPNAGQPEAGSGPERVAGQKKGEIGPHQHEQCCHREMDEHRMNRMSADGHAADNGRLTHQSAPTASGGVVHRWPFAERVAPIGLVFTPALLAGCSGPLSTLDPAGPAAASAAWLWWAMFAFATVVLVVVVALWLYAMRRDPGEVSDEAAQQVQNRWIIGGGFVLPLASITALLAFGIPAGHNMLPLASDEDVLRIDVTAHRWWWEVHYPDDDIALNNELHIPMGVPVHVHVTSEDVIHSFWVPRLAGKLDAIPGRTNVLRLQADQTGTFQGTCAEFCGVGHAHMDFIVEVHTEDDFDDWLEAARDDD